MPESLRILAFGAHPDDCDIKVGGLAIKYARKGHTVKFVSVTNGDTGHHLMGGGPLARRQYEEAQRAAAVAGIEYEVLDIHNGQLMPTLENRWWLVRIIRNFRPDLVLTHRPNDYHPDHRYTAQLVHDAAYTVTIPNVEALTPHLRYNPVIAYMSDTFRKPYPFTPDVVVGIDEVLEEKLDMLDCFESQMYEWFPYNLEIEGPVLDTPEQRRAWLRELWTPTFAEVADRYRDRLKKLYSEEQGAQIRYAEALEACEYGTLLTEEKIRILFPFFDD
ncbi:MAG: PIG-L family deacetylase [Ardenticatenaceae bacterium]|nr:PIG-L family deacetylase [Ardenticatenaceae bacterium]